MLDISFEEFNKLDFTLLEANPLIRRFGLSPIVADPSLLTPEEGDGKWQLFCHTLFGIYRYESMDGLHFKRMGRVIKNGMRPDINRIDGKYYLYYEHTMSLIPKLLATVGLIKWRSDIAICVSEDLISWSRSKTVVAHDRDYQSSKLGVSISNPFLIQLDGEYRLYYSAGLSFLDDCGFSEPTHISYASSRRPDGGFVSLENPIMSPNPKDPYLNSGCGCIKVYRLQDAYIALLNGIYVDELGVSRSAIMLFKSEDGNSFKYVKHLIKPQRTAGGGDWMAQYVYACNLKLYGGKAYIFFNARNRAEVTKGVEHIGAAVAELDNNKT